MFGQQPISAAVVGGGIAGLVAANRLADEGVAVTLIEKGEDEYLCNSRYTGGAFHICFREIMRDKPLLLEAIRMQVPDAALPDLAEAVAEDGGRAVRWLQQKGMRFIKGGPDEWQQWMLSPPSLVRPGLNWRGRGGDVMLRTLRGNFEASGGCFRQGCTASELIVSSGACKGVVIETSSGRESVTSDFVVIADGGFQGNSEMLRQYLSKRPERLRQRGAGTGNGDGIRMAQAAGAQVVGMDRCYGHLLHRDAMTNENLWPYPIMDHLATGGIVVDETGKRFADEGMGGVYMTNAVARLDDPLGSFVIFDEDIWNGPGRNFILSANPNLPAAGGSIAHAPSIDALANAIGIPSEALTKTVADYNRAVEQGKLDSLQPARSDTLYKPFAIRTAPFRAVPLVAGITYTMGGIAIDAESRALSSDGNPITGLYAAGCATGGLEGGANAGYVGGLAKSAVSALRAAESILSMRASA